MIAERAVSKSDTDDDLIARVQQDSLTLSHDSGDLCRLMRHSVRTLLDHSGAVVQFQSRRGPTRIISFDIEPRLVRALRLAAHGVAGGILISRLYVEGPVVVQADCLRTLPLGPRLRQLASGHLLLHAHADSEQASRSVFVFIGVRRGDPDRLDDVLRPITPFLHRALSVIYQVDTAPVPSLTRAEIEICRLLLEGASNKQIATALKKSDATVRNQLHATFAKLGVRTRAAAALKLRQLWAYPENRQRYFMEHLYY